MIRSKFRVDKVEVLHDARQLFMSAAMGEENKEWAKWTPSGQFTVYVTNPNAFPAIDAMRPGDFHYIDLSNQI